MDNILGYVVTYGVPTLAVVGGVCALLNVTAPLTGTKLDDKLLGVFTKLRNALAWVVAKCQTAATVKAVADQKPGVVAKLGSKFTKYAPKK